MKRWIGVLFLVVALMADAGAAVWYVDVDSTAASPDGRSWARAFRTLQQGINAAAAGGEVWVAEGTYLESRATQSDGALVLKASVAVYGGFAGTETALSQRDWKTHVTVIDGSHGRGALAAYHVVLGANGARLDGFTIRGGNANGGSNADDVRRVGGGIFNNLASPQLANLVFDGLRASTGGAAIYNLSASPTVTSCEFRNNETPGKGGAVFNTTSSAVYQSCTFTTNKGDTGGAAFNIGNSPAYRGCVFSQNTATLGGAMANANSTPTVSNCTFANNSSGHDGGAVHNESASPRFTACAFTSNRAGTASAAYGGAVYNPGASTTFTNCTFLSNSALTWGGAIYGTTAFTVMNCSFNDNRATAGGTLYNAGGAPRFTNSILWNGQPSEIANNPATSPALVNYSDVKGVAYTGTGNISSSPSFIGLGDMPLRLKPGSPCLNRGTAANAPTTDFAGGARPVGGAIDMGAFEGGMCALTLAVNGSGTVSPAPGIYHYYLQSTQVTLTATPDANWRFSGWSAGLSGTQSPLSIVMSTDRSAQANFIRQYKLTVQVQGTGTVTPGVGEHVYDSGTQVSLAVTAPTGWRFDHWEGDLTGTTAPGNVTMSADRSVKAVFVRTFTLTVAAQGSGATNPAAGTHTYAEGSVVSISATPSAGWRFDHWEGSATGSANPVQVTLSANRAVTAVFAQVPTYNLTISVDGSGSTSPAPGPHAYQEGATVSVTATPAPNWTFDHWTGGVTGSANPLSLTVTQNLSFTAVFTKIPLDIKSMSPTAGLSMGGTAMTLSVQSWTSNCRIVLGGKNCRLLGTTGSGTVQVRVAAPAITPGQYAVKVIESLSLEEDTASATFASLGDPFDARLPSSLDTGVEIDDNDALVTTYALRAWRGSGGMPSLQYQSPEGVLVHVPGSALPATATGAFLLARIAAQPADLFPGATPLPDYRLRSAVVDLHVFVREPQGSGFTYSLLTAPVSGTVSLTCPLSPGPVDPLVSGGFGTDLDDVFAALPPAPANFGEIVALHTLDAQQRAVFQLPSFGTVALFGDGPYQDINDDGGVDASDVQLVINAAIGTDIGGLNADIDGDGKVNAVDIQMVINAFLDHW